MFDMTSYELYMFIVCMIVYVVLAVLFTVLILSILRLSLKLIRNGVEDERIVKDYNRGRFNKKAGCALDCVLTGLMCLVLFSMFAFSLYTQVVADNKTGSVPTYRVVLSDSMSSKYENNTYLFDNDINNQFQRFDLILTHKLPAEEDLKLYDIVVYEMDNKLVIHRIVNIEEPNANHPNERYFRLQGDSVHVSDKYPVKYSQMKAIYKGERIPNVGSIFAFMQSPAGYMCIILIVLGIILIPLMDKKIEKEELNRLNVIVVDGKVVTCANSTVAKKQTAVRVETSTTQKRQPVHIKKKVSKKQASKKQTPKRTGREVSQKQAPARTMDTTLGKEGTGATDSTRKYDMKKNKLRLFDYRWFVAAETKNKKVKAHVYSKSLDDPKLADAFKGLFEDKGKKKQ